MRLGSGNAFLRSLGEEDFQTLAGSLETVSLARRERLIEPNQAIDYTYFPISAQISVTIAAGGTDEIEIALVGSEGVSGLVLDPIVDQAPWCCFVQVPGDAIRIEAPVLTAAIGASPAMRQTALAFLQAFITQVSFAALSHGAYSVPKRLARWLLMSHDRADSDQLPFVHEFLALMLAVRRAGVTEAVHILEGYGAIKARRGKLTIIDREKLLKFAGSAYGPTEAEYQRLIGRLTRSANT